MHYFRDYFTGIWKNRYVLASLVKQDLQMRYNRSVLGVAWSIITPFGLSVIIGLIYSIIFNTNPVTFIPLLFAGLNPWTFISGCADGGTVSFISAEGYIKQTTVNAQIFPLRSVLGGFINFLYGMVAFFSVYLFLAPENFGPKMLFFFPGLLIVLVAGIALANFSAVINLYFRDYRPLQSLILQGLFYATPIIFETTMLDQKGYSLVYKINPFYYFLEVVRSPALGVKIPDIEIYVIAIALALILFTWSVVVVMKACKGLALKL